MSKSQQNYLDQVAQRLHLTADAQSGILFGMQGGLHMMLMRSTSNQNFVSLVFSLTHSGQEPDAAEIKAFVKSNKLIVNYSIRRSRVEFILKPRFGSFKQIDQLEQVTGEVVSLLHRRLPELLPKLRADGGHGCMHHGRGSVPAV